MIIFIILLSRIASGSLPFSTVAADYSEQEEDLVDNTIDVIDTNPELSDYDTHYNVEVPGDKDLLYAGQCVNWVRYITGLDYGGNAINWTKHINSSEPTPGSVVVIEAGRWGHIGVEQKTDWENRIITVRSRNWEGKWIVSSNEFDLDDPRILGYIDY